MKYAKWISALMLLFVPIMAAAQLQPSERIVTNVPFSFVVANTVIPAGECTIQSADEQGWKLTISNRDAKVNIFVQAVPGLGKKSPAVSSLVFHKYGNRYFLSDMKIGNSREVYTFHQSKLEAEMRAQNAPVTQEILLAARK